MPAAKVRSARVAVTRVDPEVWVSPDPGEVVERATGDERAKALYLDEMGRPLPIGHRSRRRAGARRSRLLRRAQGRAHVDQRDQRCRYQDVVRAVLPADADRANPAVLGEGAANLRVLVFNVKGEDLLWLDKPNRFFDDAAAAGWAKLGVEPGPFPSVRFWAPPRRSFRRRRRPRHRRPPGGRRRLLLDAARVRRRGAAAVPASPTRTTSATRLPFIRERVQTQLRRFAVDVTGMPGAIVLRDPRDAARGELARPAGSGATHRADHHGPAVARERARRVPGTGRRGRARPRVERPRSGRHRLGVHATAARRSRPDGPAREGRRQPPDRPIARERHGRRDPVVARSGAAVRGGRPAERDVPREGGVRSAAAALGHRAGRAQQVRAPRRNGSTEGHADRHRAARAVARRAVGRRAADGVARCAPRCWRTPRSG